MSGYTFGGYMPCILTSISTDFLNCMGQVWSLTIVLKVDMHNLGGDVYAWVVALILLPLKNKQAQSSNVSCVAAM
jgi:hypothetical protein